MRAGVATVSSGGGARDPRRRSARRRRSCDRAGRCRCARRCDRDRPGTDRRASRRARRSARRRRHTGVGRRAVPRCGQAVRREQSALAAVVGHVEARRQDAASLRRPRRRDEQQLGAPVQDAVHRRLRHRGDSRPLLVRRVLVDRHAVSRERGRGRSAVGGAAGHLDPARPDPQPWQGEDRVRVARRQARRARG